MIAELEQKVSQRIGQCEELEQSVGYYKGLYETARKDIEIAQTQMRWFDQADARQSQLQLEVAGLRSQLVDEQRA